MRPMDASIGPQIFPRPLRIVQAVIDPPSHEIAASSWFSHRMISRSPPFSSMRSALPLAMMERLGQHIDPTAVAMMSQLALRNGLIGGASTANHRILLACLTRCAPYRTSTIHFSMMTGMMSRNTTEVESAIPFR